MTFYLRSGGLLTRSSCAHTHTSALRGGPFPHPPPFKHEEFACWQLLLWAAQVKGHSSEPAALHAHNFMLEGGGGVCTHFPTPFPSSSRCLCTKQLLLVKCLQTRREKGVKKKTRSSSARHVHIYGPFTSLLGGPSRLVSVEHQWERVGRGGLTSPPAPRNAAAS